MSTLATTNIKHESASTPNITLTSGGATTVNGTLNLGSSPLVTPTGSAPSYTCRAWVNFNGTGTVAIRASGNVSSITDNGTGNYTVNFTTAMPDTNYAVVGFARRDDTPPGFLLGAGVAYTKTTSAMNIGVVYTPNTALYDSPEVNCAFFR